MTDDKPLLHDIDWEARFEAEIARASAEMEEAEETDDTKESEEEFNPDLSSLFDAEGLSEEASDEADAEVDNTEENREEVKEESAKEAPALSASAETSETSTTLSPRKALPKRKVMMPTDTKIYQPERQFYDAARRARHLGAGGHAAQKLFKTKLSAFLHTQPNLSVEVVMAVLFALASESLYRMSLADMVKCLANYQRGQFKHVINCCESVALLHMKDVKKTLTGDETKDVETLLTALNPKALGRMDPAERAMHWDSVHDGHLISRESAYLLGLVRYARALSTKSEERLDFVCRSALGIGFRPANLWAEKRPLIIAKHLTPEVEKLVTDAWVCDNRVGLVLTEEPPRGHLSPVNLGVPVILDREAYIPLMLGIATDRLPAVVEHILGGVSITQATGYVELNKKLPASVAPWVKTLAEIGYTRVMKKIMMTSEGDQMTRDERAAWHRTYQLLAQKVPLKIPERQLTEEERARATEARNPYLAMRTETMSLLTRWVAEGKVRTPAQKATRARGAIHTLKSLPLRRENQMPETTEGLSTGSAQP